jgi:hypothetical protein
MLLLLQLMLYWLIYIIDTLILSVNLMACSAPVLDAKVERPHFANKEQLKNR